MSEADKAAARDRDGDGFLAVEAGGDDCDDTDAEIYPGAPEDCTDIVDSDCDDLTCPPAEVIVLDPEETWLGGSYPEASLNLLTLAQDIDGDGVLDLILTESPGPGSGMTPQMHRVPIPDSFAPTSMDSVVAHTVTSVEPWLEVSVVGDLDGDGDQEITVSTRPDEATLWLLDDFDDITRIDAGEDLPRLVVPTDASPDDVMGLTDKGITFGMAAPVGDWDGDGDHDFVFGSGGRSGEGAIAAGSVFVVSDPWSGEEPISRAYVTRIDGLLDQGGFGSRVVGGLDLNGDGHTDFVALEPGYGPEGDGEFSSRQAGANYGFTRQLEGNMASADYDVAWFASYDNSRMLQVQPVGDLNNDGIVDVAMYLGAGSGQAIFFYSPHEGAQYPEDADHRLVGDLGELPTQAFGARIYGPGDLDGDGPPDIIVGAPSEGLYERGDIPYEAGAFYVFSGPLEGVQSPEHASQRFVGDQANATAQPFPVDTDGDGVSDVVFVSARGATDPYQSGTGHGLLHALIPPF